MAQYGPFLLVNRADKKLVQGNELKLLVQLVTAYSAEHGYKSDTLQPIQPKVVNHDDSSVIKMLIYSSQTWDFLPEADQINRIEYDEINLLKIGVKINHVMIHRYVFKCQFFNTTAYAS